MDKLEQKYRGTDGRYIYECSTVYEKFERYGVEDVSKIYTKGENYI